MFILYNDNLKVILVIGTIFNQVKFLTKKNCINLFQINIQNYIKLRIPIKHRKIFIQTYCNDRNNPFEIACRQWFLQNSPQG